MTERSEKVKARASVTVDRDTSALARDYDKLSDLQFESGRLLLEGMGIGAGDVLLDVGCGTGRLALYAAGIVGQKGRVTGIDPAPHRIDLANDKLKSLPTRNVVFRIGHGESLGDYPDRSFDHVYSCHVIHWIGDKEAALREARRVLKPGGKIGMTTLNRDSRHRASGMHHTRGDDKKDAGSHKMLSGDELKALLAGAGFVDITVDSPTIKQYFSSPREVLEFFKASAFGNFPTGKMPDMTEQQWAEARGKWVEELEKRRTPRGIELQSDPLVAIAMKPY